jgi:RNA polymerase sigma factor (sigma-70 family)
LHPDESDLIELARGGDEDAIAALCRRYEGLLRRRLFRRMPRRLRKRISVADVIQETLITAIRRLSECTEPFQGSFRAWLLKIADFKAKEAVRFHVATAKRSIDAELSSPLRPVSGAWRAEGEAPSARAMAHESKEQIDAGLASLSQDHRTIIDLLHRRGFTMAEAAEQLERGADATRKLYARAISALARHLKPEDDAGNG